MSGTTTSQSLTYPTGGDSIQAAGDAVKDLAIKMDARLDAQDANLKISQFPPLTVLESKLTVNFTRSFSTPWSFDTVLVDTQGGADLAQDARFIYMRRTGYWMVGGYADLSTASGTVTAALNFNVNVNNPSSISFENVQDFQADGSNGMHGSCSTVCRVDDATNAYCFMGATFVGSFSGGDNTVPVTYRRMWAYWLGDL